MARWIYQRPLDCCNPTELVVAKRLARLSDEWVIRWVFITNQIGLMKRFAWTVSRRNEYRTEVTVDTERRSRNRIVVGLVVENPCGKTKF